MPGQVEERKGRTIGWGGSPFGDLDVFLPVFCQVNHCMEGECGGCEVGSEACKLCREATWTWPSLAKYVDHRVHHFGGDDRCPKHEEASST